MSDVAELTALGKRLLVGDGVPQSSDKGLATLRDAAARGGGEAVALLAVCAAWGVGQARNVEAALDHLVRAAQLGWDPARRELEVLARGPAADPAALRRKVDLASWRSAPAQRVVFENNPRIVVIERFATEEECRWLVARADGGGWQREGLSGQLDGAGRRDSDEPRDFVHDLERRRRPQPDPRSDRRSHRRAGVAFRDRQAPALLARRGVRAARGLHRGEDSRAGARPCAARPARRHLPDLPQRWLRRGRDAISSPLLAVPRRSRRRAAVQQCRSGRGSGLRHRSRGMPPTTGEKWVLSQWIRARPVGP